jgi:hypothetical protein
MSHALAHFLNLAHNGRRRGCSSGSAAACRLAALVAKYVPRLDAEARDGLRQFINLAAEAPTTAADLLTGDARHDC